MSDTTVIAEETWNCFGNPNIPKTVFYASRLLDDKGLQCCLGFECEQCGVARKDILNRYTPFWLAGRSRTEVAHLLTGSGFASKAMQINDNAKMSYKEKKQKLIELWAEYGWTLVFVKTVRGMKRKLKQLRD